MKINFILIILALFLVETVNLSAFCVYNNTDTKIHVEEIYGGKYFSEFIADIAPGKDSCCNWKNKDCNKKHKRNSKVEFLVTFNKYNSKGKPFCKVICKKSIKAGGELIVTGKKGKYSCRAKGY